MSNKALEITERLRESRAFLKQLWGDKYSRRIREPMSKIKGLMDAQGKGALEVLTDMLKTLDKVGMLSPGAVAQYSAACVEIILEGESND